MRSVSRLTPVPGLPPGRGGARLPFAFPAGPRSPVQTPIRNVSTTFANFSIISVGLTLTSNVFPINVPNFVAYAVFEVHERCVT